MRITEFVVNLFTRYAPVSPEVMANLKIELGDWYQKIDHSQKTKEIRNMELEKKMTDVESEMNKLDEHTPEYEKKFFEWNDLKKKKENLSIMERAISFLEKPLVRTFLLVAFVFASRWIAKKLTQPEKPDDRDLDLEDERPSDPMRYYNQPPPPSYNPYYNPYGSYPNQWQPMPPQQDYRSNK